MQTPKKQFDSRQTDPYCKRILKLVKGCNYRSTMDEKRPVCQNARFDGSLPIMFLLEALRWAVLHNDHQPIAAGHPGTGQMYDSLQRRFYWPRIASDVHSYVVRCGPCHRHGPFQKHQQWVQLFQPGWLLVFVAIEIPSPLTKIKKGKRFWPWWQANIANVRELSVQLKWQHQWSQPTFSNTGSFLKESSNLLLLQWSANYVGFLCSAMRFMRSQSGH